MKAFKLVLVLFFSISCFSGCAAAEPQTKDFVDGKYFFHAPKSYTTSKIVIYKEERELELYADSNLIGLFKIALGQNPVGAKDKEGDSKTPEGEYYICTSHDKTNFTYFLGVSYPNTQDAQRNLDNGVIDKDTFNKIKDAIDKKKQPPWNTALGGEIGIHGGGNERDWTVGCIAVSDRDINIIKEYAPLKTPVLIYASREKAD